MAFQKVHCIIGYPKLHEDIKKPRKVKEIKTEIKKCIRDTLACNPLITLDSLTKLICKECKLKRSIRTINRHVQKMGYTYKDAYSHIDYTHNNSNIKEFCQGFKMAHDGHVLISIDEAGFYIGDHRKKGWAPKGQRLAIKGAKSMCRRKFTIIVAISQDGIIDCKLLDHNCKKLDFVTFIKELKAPSGAVLLMDNLRCHHSNETFDMAESKGYDILYTPAYSPKMNPIENFFGTIKPEYRKRCPVFSDSSQSYKAIFETVIDDFKDRNLFPFFNHTMKIVRETLRGIELDPEGFIFVGYDV